MNAGSSISQKRTFLTVALLVVCLGVWSGAQSVIPAPKFTATFDTGAPCAGCLLYAYVAGTTTPQNTYTTSALSVANANPVVLDSAGRASVFLNDTLNYKFTLKTPADVEIWTQDNVKGQLASVVTISAANIRGLVITRSSAEAGLALTSVGGAGKSWGLNSTTSGTSQWRDESDGTPALQLGTGNDITATLTGTFTVSGGLFSATGFGAHTFSAGSTGGNLLQVRNTSAGTGNYGQVGVGNNTSATTGTFTAYASSFTPSGAALADGVQIGASQAGGLSLNASHASGDIRFYTGGTTSAAFEIDQGGRLTSTTQPKFLAYNSNTDAGLSTGATGDFDTEVFDVGSHFASDTFTAPVSGYYQFCASVTLAATSAASAGVELVTSNRAYTLTFAATVGQVSNGCALADMDAADTAYIRYTSGSTFDIEGGTSPYETWFTGRLVP